MSEQDGAALDTGTEASETVEAVTTATQEQVSEQVQEPATTGEAEYEPLVVIANDLGDMSFEDAVAGTIVEFEDGHIVSGTVVKIDAGIILE